MSTPLPWIALAGTPQLPILEDPVLEAAGGRYQVRTVALPYAPLAPEDTRYWGEQFAGAGAILLRSGYATAELIALLPDLRVIAVHGAGVDPVDVDACTARGVRVTNTPGANANAVAELSIALILCALRGIPVAAHATGTLKHWDQARVLGGELCGRILGLVGLGRIGARVARLARAFDARVLATDPALDPDTIAGYGAEPVSFDTLLGASDIVSLHAPAIPQTRHMIGREALAKMKSGAIVINCARGSLVDEPALAQALREGRIGGAALDVLEGEPPDPASPLYGAPNVIMLPHMAGSTRECLHTIAAVAATDIVRVLDGDSPIHPVNSLQEI